MFDFHDYGKQSIANIGCELCVYHGQKPRTEPRCEAAFVATLFSTGVTAQAKLQSS